MFLEISKQGLCSPLKNTWGFPGEAYHVGSLAPDLRQSECRERNCKRGQRGQEPRAREPNTHHVQDAHRAFSSGTLGSSYQKDNHIWSSELMIRSWFKNKRHLQAAVAVALSEEAGLWCSEQNMLMTHWRALLWRTRCGWVALPRTQCQGYQDKHL